MRSPEDEAHSRLRDLLFRAVEKRLVADVPLGAFLSGGLDSSLIVAIMSRLMQKPVKTLSVGFEGPQSHDERPFARQMADHCRTDHHEITLKPDVVSSVHDLVRYADEPFGISSAIPTLLMARAAREHLTVVLTGDGGDEMFGGYSHYQWERWAATLPASAAALPIPIYWQRPEPSAGESTAVAAPCEAGSRGSSATHGGRLRPGASVGAVPFRRRKSRPCTRATWPGDPSVRRRRLLERHAATASHLDPAAVQNWLDVAVWLPDEMLAKVDRMTMAASIEARCPLLDRDLARYLAGVPFRQKVPGPRGRRFETPAAARGGRVFAGRAAQSSQARV